MRADDLLADPVAPPRAPVGGLGRRRHVTGALVALARAAAPDPAPRSTRGTLSLESQVLLYLLVVVVIAVIGGLAVALASAVAAAFLINYFFVKPEHTLEVAQGEQALALAVFLIVAAVVSWAVEAAARRARAAEQRRAAGGDAVGLAAATSRSSDSLPRCSNARASTFGMESVTLSARRAPVGRLDRRGQRGLGSARRGGAASLRRADRDGAAADRPRAGAVRRGPAGAARRSPRPRRPRTRASG